MTEAEMKESSRKIGMAIDAFLVDIATAYPVDMHEAVVISLIGATIERLLKIVPPSYRMELFASVLEGITERFKDGRL